MWSYFISHIIYYLKMCFLESQCCSNAVIQFQDFIRTHLTEETMMSNDTDVIDHGEILPASRLLQ